MSSPKNRKIYCGNCGKNGHIYKECKEPITSLGIIGYKIINNKIYYILIERKNSYGFVEFVRGKYNKNNIKYLKHLFDEMTTFEIDLIFKGNFDNIWESLWGPKKISLKILGDEYKNSLNKYNDFITIKDNFNITPKWDGPEWGFPKGRRNINESNKNCAIREFCEETNLEKEQFKIRNDIFPISEIFVGSNNIRYKHIYYIAECNDLELNISKNNIHQKNEIRNIGWYNCQDSIELFRPYNIEKKNLLSKLDKIIKLT
jgi:8-oxo-dGTP pyrophosphatase MutT (NUDIX family)